LTPVFRKTLKRAHEIRSFDVHQHASGWECSEQTSQGVTLIQSHTDWHRVEREVARFTRQIAQLRAEGWREA